MKKIMFQLGMVCFLMCGMLFIGSTLSVHASAAEQIKINKKNFPDQKFRWYVIRKLDKNKNGSLSKKEIKAAKKIEIDRDFYAGWGGTSVLNFQGMEYFTNLQELSIYEFRLKNFDLSKMKKLKKICLFNSYIKILDLRKNKKLTTLELHRNKITKIKFASSSQIKCIEIDHEKRLQKPDFAALKKLEVLRAKEMPYKKMDFRKCKNLKSFTWCGDRLKRGVLQKISFGRLNKKLKSIDIEGGKLTSAEWLYKLPDLELLDLSYNNFTTLDVSKNRKLESLSCSGNHLEKLDISKLIALETLICSKNDLTALDVTKNSKLDALYCSKNPLISLDISPLVNLRILDCSNCQLTALDTSSNKKLTTLNSQGNLFQ